MCKRSYRTPFQREHSTCCSLTTVSASLLSHCSSLGLRDGVTRAAWSGGCGSPQPLQREQGLSKPNTASPGPSSLRLQGFNGNGKPCLADEERSGKFRGALVSPLTTTVCFPFGGWPYAAWPSSNPTAGVSPRVAREPLGREGQGFAASSELLLPGTCWDLLLGTAANGTEDEYPGLKSSARTVIMLS